MEKARKKYETISFFLLTKTNKCENNVIGFIGTFSSSILTAFSRFAMILTFSLRLIFFFKILQHQEIAEIVASICSASSRFTCDSSETVAPFSIEISLVELIKGK